MTDDLPDRFHRRLRDLRGLVGHREPAPVLDRHSREEQHFRRELLGLLPRLRGHAMALTGAPDRADDLLQDTCERALERWRQWHGEGPLGAWMLRILHNRWRDRLRAESVRSADPIVEDAAALATPSTQLEAVQLDQTLRHIRDLPPGQRAALLLVAVEGLNYREAAEVMEVPVGTVRSRLSRARRGLVEALEGGRDSQAAGIDQKS